MKKRFDTCPNQLNSPRLIRVSDVSERVVLLPRLSRKDYLALLASADVLLDPLHFGGVNSTYDGFGLNKPIVTQPSGYHRGRYISGCYWKMGFEECIAGNADEYVHIAIRLGTDADYRHYVEKEIDQRKAELFEDMASIDEHQRLFSELVQISRDS